MNNKVLVQVYVPIIQEKYDILIPNNKRLSNVLILLKKAINELSESWFPTDANVSLFNQETGQKYDLSLTVWEAKIGNGTRLIII